MIKFFILIFGTLFCSYSFGESKMFSIKADIFKMPEVVELSAVTTAGHYILSAHLVRCLTKVDRFGKIQSDLAKRWVHSNDHKTWRFWIGEEKFSNGDQIQPTDVVASIQRQIVLGTGVHFPFSEILKVYLDDEKAIVILLKTPRTDFIYDISKPEFGVLHKSDALSKKGQLNFSISSGPYFISEKKNDFFYLKRNKYFLTDVQNEADLIFQSSSGEASAEKLLKGTIEFLTTQQNLSEKSHKEIESSKLISAVKPHVAFSYWLSINTKSSNFRKKENRSKLQMLLRYFSSPEIQAHVWQKADQLYLPDGAGRPTYEELKKSWEKILKKAKDVEFKQKPKIKIIPLKMTNSLIDDLINYLKSFYEIELLSYTTEEELVKMIKSEDFDIKVSSNDFSSLDLSENLKTTFNNSRPYIFLDSKSPIRSLMDLAAVTNDKSKQSEIYKNIGLSLLDDGLIAPLAYQRVWFYHKKNIDISRWSNTFPEISFWKVKLND